MRKLTKVEERRKNRNPETDTFLWNNENPKGNIASDCVIRAIATAMDKPWDDVYDDLYRLGREMKRMPNDTKVYAKYLELNGFEKCKQPRKDDNTKYTGAEWCSYLSVNDKYGKMGAMVAHIGGHHVACIKPTFHGDGINCRYKVIDIWNSSSRCVGNFWRKKL